MNSALRFELDGIQQDQARLHQSLSTLDRRIEVFARRLDEPVAVPVKESPPAASRSPTLAGGSEGDASGSNQCVSDQ